MAGLARLLWLNSSDEELERRAVDAFTNEFEQWWAARDDAHVAYVARLDQPEIVGMAWVALVARPPKPGATSRMSGDIQSVFVLPEARGQGIGSALVQAATDHAMAAGALHITVHSGSKAVPVYERLGFESSPQLLQRHRD